MNKCIDIQENCSQWIDGDLDLTQVDELKSHLETCAACSAFLNELKSIKQNVQLLEPINPPERVWTNVRSQLSAEGFIYSKPRRTLFEKILSNPFSSSKLGWNNAIFALLILVCFLVVYAYIKNPLVTIDPTIVRSHEEELIDQLRQAESNYRIAIEKLNVVAKNKLETLDPVLAKIFTDNLVTMDSILNKCKQALKNDPQNPLVHHYLLAAYKKKVDLMQTLLTSSSLL